MGRWWEFFNWIHQITAIIRFLFHFFCSQHGNEFPAPNHFTPRHKSSGKGSFQQKEQCRRAEAGNHNNTFFLCVLSCGLYLSSTISPSILWNPIFVTNNKIPPLTQSLFPVAAREPENGGGGITHNTGGNHLIGSVVCTCVCACVYAFAVL